MESVVPELPEIETAARSLQPHLPGRSVVGANVRYRSLYRRGSLGVRTLVGREFASVGRVGKNVLFRFQPSGITVVNFGMTGQLVLCVAGERPAGFHAKHLHCRLKLDDGRELRYYDARRFGHFFIAESCDFRRDLNIGPDPFEAREPYLAGVLHNRQAAIKSLLLDQRIISGIGNIYADETLFYTGIDPRAPGDEVARYAAALLAKSRKVLKSAIEHGGSTIMNYRRRDGTPGEFQRFHAVYGRDGDCCIGCGSVIEKIVLSGRGTHFCPSCQR
jgi:formamidopyrimidine-DNA glycosylase